MVKRDLYLTQFIPSIDNELIKVITGIKRCAKSYILGLIKDELINRGIARDNIIYPKYVISAVELPQLIEVVDS